MTDKVTPWVERYRPRNLKEVSHQSEVVATLQNATATGRLPHLLFYGPPGSGKVSQMRNFLLGVFNLCMTKAHVFNAFHRHP